LPLRGVVAHRNDAWQVQSINSAPAERMLWPGLIPCSGGVHHGVPVGGPWIAGAQRHGGIRDMRPEPAPHAHRPDPACR